MLGRSRSRPIAAASRTSGSAKSRRRLEPGSGDPLRGSHGLTPLVPGRAAARLRLRGEGALEPLYRRRRGRSAPAADARPLWRERSGLVSGWPMDLFRLGPRRQPPDLEDARRRRPRDSTDARRRVPPPGVLGRPIRVLLQGLRGDRRLASASGRRRGNPGAAGGHWSPRLGPGAKRDLLLEEPASGSPAALGRSSSSTSSRGRVAELSRKNGPFHHYSLTVSPDEEWILYGEQPIPTRELMLVENFR